ncbi:MAG: response regulator [Chitinophagaceae bacterium]|jgi:CheY-like chemotaxis protein|nr:response regulator [Chitinophagaceae bacterium]
MRKEILVIDDSKAIRFMLHTILRKHYKVTSVADGVSAMYCLRKNQAPDLIIMNPELIDFPNWELVSYLQGSHLYASIPVIALSNQPESETRANAIKYGVVELFQKPFNPLRLLEAVDNLLVGNTLMKIY